MLVVSPSVAPSLNKNSQLSHNRPNAIIRLSLSKPQTHKCENLLINTIYGFFTFGKVWSWVFQTKQPSSDFFKTNTELWYNTPEPLKSTQIKQTAPLTVPKVMDLGFFFPGVTFDYYAHENRDFFTKYAQVQSFTTIQPILKLQHKTTNPNSKVCKLKTPITELTAPQVTNDHASGFNFSTPNNNKQLLFKLPQTSTNMYVLKQYRFKPGISIQWRQHRRQYIHDQKLKIFRQAKLTKYIIKAKHILGFNSFRQLALSAFYIARQSNLIQHYAFNFAKKQMPMYVSELMLNYKPVTFPLTQLYVGDVLTVVFPISQKLNVSKRENVLNFGYPRFLKRLGFQNTWKWKHIHPTPWYLEVDETLNCVVLLKEPSTVSELPAKLFSSSFFMGTKLLNWKYRT